MLGRKQARSKTAWTGEMRRGDDEQGHPRFQKKAQRPHCPEEKWLRGMSRGVEPWTDWQNPCPHRGSRMAPNGSPSAALLWSKAQDQMDSPKHHVSCKSLGKLQGRSRKYWGLGSCHPRTMEPHKSCRKHYSKVLFLLLEFEHKDWSLYLQSPQCWARPGADPLAPSVLLPTHFPDKGQSGSGEGAGIRGTWSEQDRALGISRFPTQHGAWHTASPLLTTQVPTSTQQRASILQPSIYL